MMATETLATRTPQRDGEVMELGSGRVSKVARKWLGEERADSMVEPESPATKHQDGASIAVLRLMRSPGSLAHMTKALVWMAFAT